MSDILPVRQIEITFAHRKMIHSVQHIRFSRPVIADKAIEPRAAQNLRRRDIFIIHDIQPIQYQIHISSCIVNNLSYDHSKIRKRWRVSTRHENFSQKKRHHLGHTKKKIKFAR